MRPRIVDLDAVIVGAGVAGLSAARELSAAGLKLALIEARERIGGRIFTIRDPLAPVPIEVGAEFVHGEPPELISDIRTAGLTAAQVMGDHMCFRSGSIGACREWMDKVFAVLESMSAAKGQDRSFQSFIEDSDCDDEAKAGAVSFVEGFNAADRYRVGVHSLIRQQKAGDAINGEKTHHILDGYDTVPRFLFQASKSNSLSLHLNTVVEGIEWRRGKVQVAVKSRVGPALEPMVARKAVVTLPLGVLQADTVRFLPEVPGIRDTLDRLAMGKVQRVTLRFREPFWESRADLSNMSFLHSGDEWFPTWWTVLPVRAPILTGWAGGPKAARFDGHSESFLLERAMDALSRFFGIEVKMILGLLDVCYTHNWQADPFSLGAYSYVPVGSLPAVEKLTEPIEDTLYFAGEATNTEGHWGTVHGAMATGIRAARQILAS